MIEHIVEQLHCQPGIKFLELERSVQNDSNGFISLVDALRQNQTVRYIYLCGEFFDSLDSEQRRYFLDASRSLASLKCLYMANAKLSIDAVHDLASTFSRSMSATLQEISFQHLHILDGVVLDSMVKSIAKFPVLERVEIGVLFIHHSEAALSPEALAELCQSGSLKALTLIDLRLNHKHFRAMAEVLSHHRSLSELSLWGEVLGPACCHSIAEMLGLNTSLRSLCIYFATIDNGGIEAIADSIGRRKNLRSFSIENEDNSITQKGVTAMSRMLEQNPQMESLSLATKGLDDEGCIQLCAALESHPSLRELSLDNSLSTSEGQEIGSRGKRLGSTVQMAGFSALSNMLKVNKSIRRLDLSGILLDGAGVAILASSLWKNSTLREINFGTIKLEASEGGTTENTLENVFKVIEETMEQNLVLEKISTEHDTLTLNFGERINLFLSLNQRGLRTLMVDVNESRDSFLESLAENSFCVDTLFYLLSMNPSFMVAMNGGW